MISYVNNTDFFTLLGLDKLSEEDRSKYEEEVLDTLINSVFTRILEDSSIPEDRKSLLKEFLGRSDIDGQSFDEVMDKFPESDKFIDQEIYILKKEMIREMISDTLLKPELTADEKVKLDKLSEMLNSDKDDYDYNVTNAMDVMFKYI